jgi:hypothetical protein
LKKAQHFSPSEERCAKKLLDRRVDRERVRQELINQERSVQTFAGNRVNNPCGGERSGCAMSVVDHEDLFARHSQHAGQDRAG